MRGPPFIVGDVIEGDTDPPSIDAHARSNLGRVLVDAGGENDSIEPPERRRE